MTEAARGCALLRALVLTIAISSTGCSTSRDVTKLHPHAASLLRSCTTDAPIYLYGNRRERAYHVFTQKITGYHGPLNTPEVSEPTMSLPAGTLLIGTKLRYESTIGTGPAIWIYGVARPPNGEEQQVRDVVDLVGIDLVEWQKKHPFQPLPPASEYLKRSTQSEPDWCVKSVKLQENP